MKGNTIKTFKIEGLGKVTMEVDAWNSVCLAFLHEIDFYEGRNAEFLGNKSRNIAFQIHDKLTEIGYFD